MQLSNWCFELLEPSLFARESAFSLFLQRYTEPRDRFREIKFSRPINLRETKGTAFIVRSFRLHRESRE